MQFCFLQNIKKRSCHWAPLSGWAVDTGHKQLSGVEIFAKKQNCVSGLYHHGLADG